MFWLNYNKPDSKNLSVGKGKSPPQSLHTTLTIFTDLLQTFRVFCRKKNASRHTAPAKYLIALFWLRIENSFKVFFPVCFCTIGELPKSWSDIVSHSTDKVNCVILLEFVIKSRTLLSKIEKRISHSLIFIQNLIVSVHINSFRRDYILSEDYQYAK